MSFSSDAKTEICRTAIGKKCCALAECYGILLYCNTFTGREIKIITENSAVVTRMPRLFRRAFDFEFDFLPDESDQTGKRTLAIRDPGKIAQVFSAYGYEGDSFVAHHINLGILEDECCHLSFIRGAFLAGGSVTSPEKRYHLELVTDHFSVSRETYSILLEMGFEPKDTARNGHYMIYFKQSGSIEDFLTTIGAPVAAMEVMSAKIEKDMRNSVNRRVNCDTANVTKIVDAAQQQIDAIRKIESFSGLQSLPDKLRETAQLRIRNPEASLSELAGLSSPPVTKSCLNHRLRKLVLMAGQIGKKSLFRQNERSAKQSPCVARRSRLKKKNRPRSLIVRSA
jgi:DNA-binding protein WhiA